ncbi:tetratricopeptide repeat protein [Kibdelosporangium lantanae]|uniref:Tetratricopeptide repeat protein n=1 Tax=Kibdelosporangium lantanae TaxID=1497396 RepID=A0ABW3M164_9PSEU
MGVRGQLPSSRPLTTVEVTPGLFRATSIAMNHLDEADAALRRYAAVAVDRYVKACEQDTSDRALAGLVRALWQARLWDHARKQLARLDGHGSVHAELARGMVALGQPDRIWWLGVDSGSAVRDDVAAEAAFSAAIALDPANAEARAGHATALRMAGRLREAREELKSLDDALLATAVVQLELAICAFEDDDLALADEHSRRAMEHEPGSVRAELVLLEIARHTDRGSADVVTQAKSLAARNPVRVVGELYGWVLFDRAKNSADQKQALTEALTVFTKAAPPQGVWPGVVGGRAVVTTKAQKLTSDIVVRALSALGIAEVNKAVAKGGNGITFPAPIVRDGPGWRADVDLPYGVTVADILARPLRHVVQDRQRAT